MRAFWDTNLFIYLLEDHPTFSSIVLRLYDELRTGGGELWTSALTLGELCTRPMKAGRLDLVEQYRGLLLDGNVKLVSFDAATALEYASIRATTPLKQPDAMQVACAIQCAATAFYTNDHQLTRASPIRGLAINGIRD